MGFAIDLHARARKRLLRRAPDAKELADRLGRLARRMLKDAVAKSGRAGGKFVVELAFHPDEPNATLAVEPDGQLVLHVDAGFVGPAYPADVVARLAPLFEELEVAWTEPFDLAAIQRAACEWVADLLRPSGNGRVDLGIERPFVVDAPVLTPLGPRDAAWRDAVLADPMHAADAFAWWQLGPGHAERARALLAMWNEVPWREPVDRDELALMKRVDRNLRAAHRADADLALPWPEWALILDYLGNEAAYVDEVKELAAGKPATIGYRRYELDVELTGGWVARLPGAFVGSWEDDGERYWATDGQRSIEFTSVTAEDDSDSARLLAVAPERHEVIERFVDGARHGRAEVTDVDGLRVVHGLVADAPHVAIMTCKGTGRDEPWALATLRALRNHGTRE